MMADLRILVLLFMSTVVEGIELIEPTNCSSLVQRDVHASRRTSDLLEIANKDAETTWDALQRHRQMLSRYWSDVERILAGQKPQSNSSWIMMTISVVITAVMLLGGCLILSRVQKAWNASVSGQGNRSQVPSFPGSTSSLGSTRAVQRAPKPSGDVTSSLGAARAREELPVLCDDLVVPENRECVLLVPKLDRDEVAINDHQGQQVFVAQRSEEEDSRIVLMSPTHEIFATVRSSRASGGMAALAIHGPYEKEFGILKGMKGGDYELTGSGRRIRFQTSSGRLNIVDEDTRIMALSESERGQRQFRIGPQVDVGLVICCVLGIDLLESDFR